jgi:hypothetical protein
MQAAGTTGAAEHPGLPCAMVYGLYALSPGTGCLAPVFCHNAHMHRTRHQHRDARTTRFRRTCRVVRLRVLHMSMMLSESCGALCINSLRFRIMLHAATSTRPPHSAPNVRDDRETSLSIGNRTRLRDTKFGKYESEKSLRSGLDKGDRLESLREKRSWAQRNRGRAEASAEAFPRKCDHRDVG